jgi:hypothetical protein
MKITYNKNPLLTTIELDDHEKEVFRLKLKIKELEETVFSAHFHLTEKYGFYNVDDARKELNPDYWLDDSGDKPTVNKRIDEMFDYYMVELQSAHCGDCTCVPCSCDKCSAESLLGIDTIPKLGKHVAYQINHAFGKNSENTLDDALEALRVYVPTAAWEGWEPHAMRWRQEATDAYEWLKNYRDEHYPEE